MFEIPNPDRSHYEAVVEAICTMDIAALQKLFKGQKYMDDVPVITMLGKLETAFKKLKQKGDEQLNRIPGYCDGCQKGKGGFRFIAPIAKKELTLIFEVDDKKVKDFCNCGIFYSSMGENEKLEVVEFSVYTDEKFPFYKTKSYLKLERDCNEAMSEFDFENVQVLTHKTVSNWLAAYKVVFDKSRKYWNHSTPIALLNFYLLISEIKIYFTAQQKIKKATSEFQEAWLILEEEFKHELRAWFTKYEKILCFAERIERPIDFDSLKSFAFNSNFPTIHIATKDFKPLDDFLNRFSKLYWDDLKTQNDKSDEYYEDDDDDED